LPCPLFLGEASERSSLEGKVQKSRFHYVLFFSVIRVAGLRVLSFSLPSYPPGFQIASFLLIADIYLGPDRFSLPLNGKKRFSTELRSSAVQTFDVVTLLLV